MVLQNETQDCMSASGLFYIYCNYNCMLGSFLLSRGRELRMRAPSCTCSAAEVRQEVVYGKVLLGDSLRRE